MKRFVVSFDTAPVSEFADPDDVITTKIEIEKRGLVVTLVVLGHAFKATTSTCDASYFYDGQKYREVFRCTHVCSLCLCVYVHISVCLSERG